MQTHRNRVAILMVMVIGSVLLVLSPHLLAAQTTTLDETCPPFVSEALNKLDITCQGLGRNSLCYGNNLVTVQFTQAFTQGAFNQPADQTELKNVEYIQTAPLDEVLNQWGLALMNVQANVPGTLPGQGVVFILMGNAEMQNKVDPSDTTNTMSPMQAFQFTGGIGTPGCKSAQGSLVIQGPDNVVVDLEANGAKIRLASTILLTQRENKFSITTLSGAAKVDEVIVPAGFTTTSELDEDNIIIEFTEVEPVDTEDESFDLYEEIAADTLNYEIDFAEFEDEWDEAYTEYEDNGGEFEDNYPCLDDPESDDCAIYTDEMTSEDVSTDTPADDSGGDDSSDNNGSADDGSADDTGGDTGDNGSTDDSGGDDGSTDDGSADDTGGDTGGNDDSGDNGSADDGSAGDNGGDDGGGDNGGGDDGGGDTGGGDDGGGEQP